MKLHIELPATGERLDVALTRYLQEEEGMEDIRRAEITKAFSEGRVCLTETGVCPKSGLKLDKVTGISLELPDRKELSHEPENIPLDIVYEDEDLLVINKPRGMVVHPAPGHPDGTLVNALLYHCGGKLSDVNDSFRPGIVHRIDKDTSGLLVVAKTNAAHHALAEQLERHDIKRVYMAVVYGSFAEQTGRIEAPIGRDAKNRQRMAVTMSGKPAVTHFEVLESFSGLTLVRCELETGRTHQIRVHMKFVGHPVVADPLYAPGRKNYGLDGQLLHAAELRLTHPRTGEELVCTAPLPPVFEDFLAARRRGEK